MSDREVFTFWCQLSRLASSSPCFWDLKTRYLLEVKGQQLALPAEATLLLLPPPMARGEQEIPIQVSVFHVLDVFVASAEQLKAF